MIPYAYDPYSMPSNVPIQAGPYPMQPVVAVPVAVPANATPMGAQFVGMQYVYVQDPLAELANCTSAIIRQQPELFEAFTGCETANRYHVFGNTPQGLKYLFKCKENSECLMRFFCPSNLREFDMDINHIVSDGGQVLTKTFAKAFKPFKCTCFCCNRPIINVSVGDNPIGSIKNLFSCFDPEFEVYEANGNLKYFVYADCCQCGLLCANNICGKFSSATFNICAPGTINTIATITKMSAQSFSEVITDADSYQVSFPKNASPNDKLLLIALGLMIDYQYFETDANDNNEGRHHHRRHNRYYRY